jgi:hypothetical protein
VLLVDCLTGESNVLHRGSGLYYGIARIGSDIAIAARRRLVSSPVSREEERGCILRFDRDLRVRDTLEAPFALRDIHQIAWFDERLWMTCSFDDMIAVHDGAAWERWTPEFPPVIDPTRSIRDVDSDRHHFNSFFVASDEVALLAHNHGPSDLHFFDRRTRSFRRTVSLGSQAHNVWRDDDAFVTCSSIEGKLVGTNGWSLATGGFPRGVCFDADHRAIGISALSERGQRDFASAAIALYDPRWRLLHYVHLVREGMILDLLPLTDAEFDTAAKRLEHVAFPVLEQLELSDLGCDDAAGRLEGFDQ